MADVSQDGTMLRQSWKFVICPPWKHVTADSCEKGCGTILNAEFSFILVDWAGVCLTFCTPITGCEATNLPHIVFVCSYAHLEFLSIDTWMTVDFFSGNVCKIRVEAQEFKVIKHVQSSLAVAPISSLYKMRTASPTSSKERDERLESRCSDVSIDAPRVYCGRGDWGFYHWMKGKTGWPTPRTPPSVCIDWSHGGHLNLFLLLWRICQSAPGLHWL